MTELSHLWQHLQRQLFPLLAEEIGPLSAQDHEFIKIIGLLPLGAIMARYGWGGIGRPPPERIWLLHALVAKAVYQIPTTKALVQALQSRPVLRRLCGWESAAAVPDETVFCRVFARFSRDELPQQIHAALVQTHCAPKLVGHVSRDATAIEAREKPVRPAAPPPAVKFRPGRPSRGEVRPPKPPSKLEVQRQRGVAENLADLPRHCAIGCKRNSHGHTDWWMGYKLHLDVIDGDIPVSAVLTSATCNEVQVAIPLSQMTAQRVRALYELMDAAYDAESVRQHVQGQGRIALIARNSRGLAVVPMAPADARRYDERNACERVNSRLKDQFGGRTVRVRGAAKVMCHLMFGVLAITTLALWNRLC